MHLCLRSYGAIKVYFHAENQFLDLSGRMGYKAFPKQRVEAQVTYEDISLISKRCATGDGWKNP